MNDRLRQQVAALVALLEDWARWQQGYRVRLGYPSRSIGMASNASQDFDELCESVDQATLRIIDATIQEDLLPAECCAVLRRYGVSAVWRFPRNNYEQMLCQAHEKLMVLLPRKGVMLLVAA